MARYVYSPLYPVADKWQGSHRAGWAAYWAKELSATLVTTAGMAGFLERVQKKDTVFIYHGMEWNGSLNLQSGLTDTVFERAALLAHLAKKGASLISLDIEMPNYMDLLRTRLYHEIQRDAPVPEAWKKLDWQALTKAEAGAGFQGYPMAENWIVGDSHALSLYQPGSVIHRTDGLTLYGALDPKNFDRLFKALLELEVYCSQHPKSITFYLGNIDVRHHFARPGAASVSALLPRYKSAIHQISRMYPKTKLIVSELLPIHDDSRKIPKTGWFKGTPYFGTWEERHKLMTEFNNGLEKTFKGLAAIYRHPAHFTDSDGKLALAVCEQPQSVHIRPSEYRIAQGEGW